MREQILGSVLLAKRVLPLLLLPVFTSFWSKGVLNYKRSFVFFLTGNFTEDEDQCYFSKPENSSWKQFAKFPIKLSSPTTFVTKIFGNMFQNETEVLFVVGKK